MCLGIPGQIISISNHDSELGMVDIGGNQREVNLTCAIGEGETLDNIVGQWVVVHVGFAMSKIDEKQAFETLKILEQLGEMQQEVLAMNTGAQ